MKKFLAILVLGLLWCNVGFAEDVKLKCQGELDMALGHYNYVTFNEKEIKVFKGRAQENLTFHVHFFIK